MFDKDDALLLSELAKSHTCAQLADKWDVTYRRMANYLYRHKISPVMWQQPIRNRKVSDTVKQVIALHKSGMSLTEIALQVGRSAQYVSVILKRADCDPVATRRKEMIAKTDLVVADSERMGESFAKLALLYYGWSLGKAKYWLAQSKKAAL